jgi:dynein heavy chain
LAAAEQLISGLATEKVNWGKRAENLRGEALNILGDIIMCAGIISYLGPFPNSYRDTTCEHWIDQIGKLGIPTSPNFLLREIISDEITIGNWTNNFKLPNDSFSIDNAIIMMNSRRYPLFIDPQIQANRWIKEMELKNNLLVLKPSASGQDIANKIQNAIELGIPVLIEGVDEKIDSSFTSVLAQDRKTLGGVVQQKFGDKWVDLHKEFRFYVSTKLPKPHYSPEICVMVTLLNFTVTPIGLEDQLLNIIVSKEDPNSDKARMNNVREFFDLMKKQKDTEDKILHLLSNAEGNILDNEVLISELNNSKIVSEDATRRLVDIEKMKEKHTKTRKFYQNAANRAANLFFCVSDLSNVEPMYQWSLDWFIDLYKYTIDQEPKVKETRVEDVINLFTKFLYQRISRSLFEKDKLLFSFLIWTKVLTIMNFTNLAELRTFMIGGTALTSPKENAGKGWLSDKAWAQVCEISIPGSAFEGLDDDFAARADQWKDWYDNPSPQDAPYPGEWSKQNKLTYVQKLIILRVLRSDKVIQGIQNAISEDMGRDYVEAAGFTLESIFVESKCNTPIIFILSPGSDPLTEVFKLGDLLGKTKSIDILALGQGQEATASEFINLAKEKGRWVVLQNCHLAPKYLTVIEREMDTPGMHLDYRIWLTSMPTTSFPVAILQNGIKITNEPPRGMKSNLARSFMSLDNRKYEDCAKPDAWKKLLFGLSFFHGIIQERRKFGALGWNNRYDFSQMDFEICRMQLKMFLDDYETVQWKALWYIFAECNYGGRVTDPMDRRLIKVILQLYITEDIFKDNYKFSESGKYFAPPLSDLNTVKTFIKENMPFNDDSEVFGMHENAEITSGMNISNELMETVLGLSPKAGGGGGQSADSIIKEKVDNILEKLPQPFDVNFVAKRYPIIYKESMNTVLQQE